MAKKTKSKDTSTNKKKSNDSSSNSSSSNSSGSGSWNIDAAVQHLEANAGAKTKHLCARYVVNAIRAGGLNLKGLSCAKLWHESPKGLKSYGFQEYQPQMSGRQCTNAQKGDVEVQVYPPNIPYGHMCMYTGSRWISDFRQNFPGVRGDAGSLHFYRYTGTINGGTLGDAGGGGAASGGGGGGGATGTGNGIVKLRVNWGGALSGADYPAGAKLTTQGWEVKGSTRSASYDPYASLETFKNISEKTETITTAEPSETNFKHIKIQNDAINESISSTTAMVSKDITSATEAVSSLTNDMFTTLASGNINPNDYTNLLERSALNFKSLWDKDKYTGILEAFGFTCPVCGKKVKYVPVNGYCSLKCFLSDMKTSLISTEKSTTTQLKEFTESNMNVIKNYVQMVLGVMNDLPESMKDMDWFSENIQEYVQVRYNYLAQVQKYFINRVLIWKNKLLISWLTEYMNGVARKDPEPGKTPEDTDNNVKKAQETSDESKATESSVKQEAKPDQESTSPETAAKQESTTESSKSSPSATDNNATDSNAPLGSKENPIELPESEDDKDEDVSTEDSSAKKNIAETVNNGVKEAEDWLNSNIDSLGENFIKNSHVMGTLNELSSITKNIETILKYKDKFEEIYQQVYQYLNNDITKVIPSDSFGFMATNRAMVKNPMWPYYVDISCPASVKYSMPEKTKLYKFSGKQGASRPKLDKIKKLVDKIVEYSFPPIHEFEYLLDPQAFAIRLIFSDQNFKAIAKNIEKIFSLLQGEPSLLPEYKDLKVSNIWYMQGLMKGIVPTIQFTYGKIAPPSVEASLT